MLLSDWISIGAALLSAGSVYWTRKQFIRNNRPFVWAGNLSLKDKDGAFHPAPSWISFKVYQAPARIIEQQIKIFVGEGTKPIYEYNSGNLIRHPDNTVEWTHTIEHKEFCNIIKNNPGPVIKRSILVKYRAIDSDKVYSTWVMQTFDANHNQWLSKEETAI